ncbi:hypothetical protein HQN88_17840 [Paenibacillus qinlingensis]|nr:hypothetical protein [Paenibacillus qinlingensis]NQX60729.1 hypothetical protein [Paenibacillus qinlingensis]
MTSILYTNYFAANGNCRTTEQPNDVNKQGESSLLSLSIVANMQNGM